MSKRKLNRRQKWRIEKIQAEKAARAEKKESRTKDQLVSGQLGEEQTGLVIAHYGQLVDVESTQNNANEGRSVYRCHVRANLDSLVTGDRVVWREGPDQTGVIEARLDRDSLLQRPDNYGQLKPVAANIDRILVVVATEPKPHANLIDRYLVAAETIGIKPAILFNKADLLNEHNRAPIDELRAQYESLDYEVLQTDAYDLDNSGSELIQWLTHHTSIFVGQSGVGKSSLIRSILGDQSIRVGELSETTRKGTHTTTTAKLFHLPNGGRLIDSPGIREFGLWHVTKDELLEGFIEFRPFIGYCRFRDCQHLAEPGCAINEAVVDGRISKTRFESYQRILNTLDDKETWA